MTSEIIQGGNSAETSTNTAFNSTPMCLDLTAEDAADYLEELKSRKNMQIETYPFDLIDSATANSNNEHNSAPKNDT